jgi:ribosome biogenesis GTPase
MELNLNLINNNVFRVVFESRENYRLLDENQQILDAEMSGHFRQNSPVWPAVGDWVKGSLQKGAEGNWLVIEELLPRTSEVKRPDVSGNGRMQILAANVDILFVVTSANHDLNFNRLDRFILLAQATGVKPVVLINKVELCEDPRKILDQLAERYESIDIHALSAVEKINLEVFDMYLKPNTTIVFVGSSGVGKSSLTNYLLDSEEMLVSEIRESDSRGRHTTTHRELQMAKNNVAIIDTPGLRSVGLTDEVDFESLFADLENLMQQCKFRDCRHENEPKCAVLEALHNGELPEE